MLSDRTGAAALVGLGSVKYNCGSSGPTKGRAWHHRLLRDTVRTFAPIGIALSLMVYLTAAPALAQTSGGSGGNAYSAAPGQGIGGAGGPGFSGAPGAAGGGGAITGGGGGGAGGGLGGARGVGGKAA
jgi:hypothetical protein